MTKGGSRLTFSETCNFDSFVFAFDSLLLVLPGTDCVTAATSLLSIQDLQALAFRRKAFLHSGSVLFLSRNLLKVHFYDVVNCRCQKNSEDISGAVRCNNVQSQGL